MAPRRLQRPRRLAALAVVGLGAALLAVASPGAGAAPAAPAQLSPDRPFAAFASGDLLTLTVANIPTVLEVANLHLVHSEAEANSVGPVNGDAALRTFARAANFDPLAVLEQLDLSDLLSEEFADAPPSEAKSAELITLPGLEDVADLSVANVDVLANWVGDTECVASDEPLSQARNEVATLEVLGNVVSLTPQGAVHTLSTTSLPSIPGPGDARAVVAESVSQTAGISIADGVLIEVVGDPTLTATATGLEGGASVDYAAPVLRVNGDDILTAQDLEDAIVGPLLGALGPLLELLDPLLSIDVGLNVVSNLVEEADGTFASADAALATVTITVPALSLTVLDLAIMPMSAAAMAPAGGIDCGEDPPITLGKTASDQVVQPGDTFDYTITVTNTSNPACTLTDVTVTDTITGPAGSTVVGTSPPATVNGLVVTWTGLGPIGPGQSIQLTITVRVPSDARPGDSYDDTVVAEGLCDDELVPPVQFDLPDIPKIGELPATGRAGTYGLLAGAGLLSVAVAVSYLRRRSTTTV